MVFACIVVIHTNAVCKLTRRFKMAWTTPAAIDLRFGFEITMYIANR